MPGRVIIATAPRNPIDTPCNLHDSGGTHHTGDTTMPKIELRMTDADKALMQAAADASQLRLATWAKAQLMIAAMGAGRGDGQ